MREHEFIHIYTANFIILTSLKLSIFLFYYYIMEDSLYIFIIFTLFLIVIFILPFRNDYELFNLKNNGAGAGMGKKGFCGPDFSQFSLDDNVHVQCIGTDTMRMTEADCCQIRNSGTVCGVNADNWESYECNFQTMKNDRCENDGIYGF